jgi:histidinol-phosphate aminotransferase
METIVMTDKRSPAVSASLHLARAMLRDVVPYPTEREPCEADLSDNTNLFGAPPAAVRELARSGRDDITRYPGVYTRRLREALAEYAHVRPNEVITGCGSDDVIDSAIRAFAEPGDSLAFSDPTFSMIPVFARVNGVIPVPVPFTALLDIDPDALLATGARVIYICSPNNPTGVAPSPTAIDYVLDRAPGLVILDEAYAEFAGVGRVAEGPQYERLLVTRTLSKAFGMAGLRIGYGTGSAALVHEIEKVRGPYKENGPGERAAACALREDVQWMRHLAAQAVEIRERFIGSLRERGFAPIQSATNFVLIPVDDAMQIGAMMRANGVAVRPYPALRGLGDTVRVTVAPWPVMERALDTLCMARDEIRNRLAVPS